jgi:hypothetical protein
MRDVQMYGNVLTVRSSTDLSQEALEVVLLEPLGSCLHTRCADGRGDTRGRSTRAIAIEVLVHL